MFRSLTYYSTALRWFSSKDLISLLEQSRNANAKFGITGMLLYKSGTFVQTIEGPPDAVGRLYANICKDGRHRGQIKALDEHIVEREFPRWSMGFNDVLELKEHHRLDFTDFLKSEEEPQTFFSNPSNAKKLLLSFKTG